MLMFNPLIHVAPVGFLQKNQINRFRYFLRAVFCLVPWLLVRLSSYPISCPPVALDGDSQHLFQAVFYHWSPQIFGWEPISAILNLDTQAEQGS